jgi:murein DD-endopeptidase MepM/ murein hydrolase activator NlpD
MKSLQPLSIQTTSNHTELSMQEEKLKVEEVEEEGQEIELPEEKTSEDTSIVETKEEEKGEVEEPAKEETDELENYSDSVKKRISKLTSKFREEERQRQAAIEYAEAVKKQNEELQSKLSKLDTTYVGEFDTRVQSQSLAAKEAYRKAVEENDVDAMYEAQQNISRIALEEARLAQIKAQREEQVKAAEGKSVQTEQPQAQPQAQPKPDPKAEEWASKNTWFGQDQTMTYAAFGLHKQLIEEEGFDATSDDYYTELDNRIRSEFPHKFQEAPKKSSSPRVASAGTTASKSSSPKGRRTVKLTASQIAIAKRLNVPLEEYAKYVKE